MAVLSEQFRFSLEFNSDTETEEPVVQFYDFCFNETRCYLLLEWCEKFNVLSDDMISIINSTKLQNGERYKVLHKTVQDNIKAIESHKTKIVFGNILTNLKLLDECNLIENTDELVHENHLQIVEIKMCKQLCSSNSDVPVYPMRTKNRGVLFFVNIRHFPNHSMEHRSGSEHDKFYMISLFRKFGFKIFYYENLLYETFCTLVDRLKCVHLSDTESLVFIVASHGNGNNEIEFYCHKQVEISMIIAEFSNARCPQMEGKPKIFIFPSCRGKTQDFGITQYRMIETDGQSIVRPTFSDILICYATVHGFVSNRDTNFGSWFIEAFYKVLAETAHILDLDRMLGLITTTVNTICAECVVSNQEIDPKRLEIFQTPSYIRWDFNKLLFFNPGYVEDI